MNLIYKNIILAAAILVSVLVTPEAKAFTVGEAVNFNVDKDFDASARSQVSAVLVKTSSNLYFYVEKNWWEVQAPAKQNEILGYLDELSLEFDKKIYPNLTSIFGSEWKPGVDGDPKITILFHALKENAGGYFRSADEYLKLQIPDSNEREMVYLPIAHIDSRQLKVFLAHEFVHLITFNQKDKLREVQEEIWLNEARADYSSTILGYDSLYDGSNLQRRVRNFLEKPFDSLTEWQENKYDYAVASLFTHYLVDHYSINVLADSLKSKAVGIASINEVLQKNNEKEDFAQIFIHWTIATLINDCSVEIKHCYLNQNLRGLRINPTLNFLPLSGSSSLSVTNVTKNWAGNWQKFIGGKGDLTLEFTSLAGLSFKVPYLIFNKDGSYAIRYLDLDQKEKGQLEIENFGDTVASLVIIPSLQSKTSDFNGLELTYPYTFTVSIVDKTMSEEEALIQKLLVQIEFLKKQIVALQSGVGNPVPTFACGPLNNNLYKGTAYSSDVTCLQNFLKSQGPSIYPEGLVTGSFGNLTKSAVIRFQEKYKEEILAPLGLLRGTGFVGPSTRIKINKLLLGGA
ncbi:MAG: hypothetical protein A3A98_03060 [Candidatus Staskawiczbacteria bacterium RIFCSPLOWO2_01_FULL_40_39]|uniref:Peptidoglycan binding-like domain-containing protein n=1 Tax=Candidatus Staskawiczbacteria bacterium RIFCSPHIGHO2_01_FULL_39_25 TaxID=1802202 RepID=A0A1G2HN39_9BACT|nr:MAG: hypothetical protein A2730_01360 [Candidatus Staskawiczbacteria bacterium RIFCSPHIGHO2_01_FULL_39_25]OGZ73002.1 MAG: hypothetical protein A3A98_03060 [Candidatus Staskawiczbacteria bacterium RIFCSPLOWO2_01_FULL_40_39]